MIGRRELILGAASSCLLGRHAYSQCAPVDLGIRNIRQETQVWCWAAVAQQIIHWRTGNSPPQCALVAMANNAHPQFCCTGNPQCLVTGSLQQIQWLIGQFGFSYSTIAPPAGPVPVYETISARRPIIMAVYSSPYSGHVVVIRGMSCMGPNPVLHINDPIGWSEFAQPVAFHHMLPYWRHAIVVG